MADSAMKEEIKKLTEQFFVDMNHLRMQVDGYLRGASITPEERIGALQYHLFLATECRVVYSRAISAVLRR